jgi:hypothetical protein
MFEIVRLLGLYPPLQCRGSLPYSIAQRQEARRNFYWVARSFSLASVRGINITRGVALAKSFEHGRQNLLNMADVVYVNQVCLCKSLEAQGP